MFDCSTNFQFFEEVQIMSNSCINRTPSKSSRAKSSLSTKVTLTRQQINKIGVESLQRYVNNPPETDLGKFLDL